MFSLISLPVPSQQMTIFLMGGSPALLSHGMRWRTARGETCRTGRSGCEMSSSGFPCTPSADLAGFSVPSWSGRLELRAYQVHPNIEHAHARWTTLRDQLFQFLHCRSIAIVRLIWKTQPQP